MKSLLPITIAVIAILLVITAGLNGYRKKESVEERPDSTSPTIIPITTSTEEDTQAVKESDTYKADTPSETRVDFSIIPQEEDKEERIATDFSTISAEEDRDPWETWTAVAKSADHSAFSENKTVYFLSGPERGGETIIGNGTLFPQIKNRTLLPDVPTDGLFGNSLDIYQTAEVTYLAIGNPEKHGKAHLLILKNDTWNHRYTIHGTLSEHMLGAGVYLTSPPTGSPPNAVMFVAYEKDGAQHAVLIGENNLVRLVPDFDDGSALVKKLSDIVNPKPTDRFGISKDSIITENGEFVAVGAPGDDIAGENAGAVYIFKKEPEGGYQLIEKAVPLIKQEMRTNLGFGSDLGFTRNSLAIHGSRYTTTVPINWIITGEPKSSQETDLTRSLKIKFR